MSARIEVAELVSFRLKVPKEALQRLPEELAGEVPLSLTVEDGELVLSDTDADSFLRFRPIGAEAVLTDAAVLNDARGRFFRSAFCALLVRFGGDLRARLVWSDEARNNSEAWTDVRVDRGATRFPGLASAVSANRLAAAASADAVFGHEGAGDAPPPHEASAASPESDEVAELLARAAKAWEEYQRLKAERLQVKG
ncbi:MAG: hypothetical protein L0Y66_17480 [Myxococcaceae bacterium]|nr:hypothetical protein [Myxococcaceae bacterium]